MRRQGTIPAADLIVSGADVRRNTLRQYVMIYAAVRAAE